MWNSHRDLSQANAVAIELLRVKRPSHQEISCEISHFVVLYGPKLHPVLASNPLSFAPLIALQFPDAKILQHAAVSIGINRYCDSIIVKKIRSNNACRRWSARSGRVGNSRRFSAIQWRKFSLLTIQEILKCVLSNFIGGHFCKDSIKMINSSSMVCWRKLLTNHNFLWIIVCCLLQSFFLYISKTKK